MKTAQLQIRLSPAQKAMIKRRAAQAGVSVSCLVLRQIAPQAGLLFARVLSSLRRGHSESFALAELNDLLTELSPVEFEGALAGPLPEELSERLRNQIAAMVEHAAYLKNITAPAWTRAVRPLERPWFATELPQLRAHLLRASPVAFRRRNLFVDSTIGDRA